MKHPEDQAPWLRRKNRDEIFNMIEVANRETTYDGKPRKRPPLADKFFKAMCEAQQHDQFNSFL